MFTRKILSVLTILLISLGTSQAAVLYENGVVLPAFNGVESTSNVVADDFAIASGGSISSAGVYMFSASGGWDGTLEYSIFYDAAGSPGALLTSGLGQNIATSDTGTDYSVYDVFLFEFDLENPFAAAAGATYWFGVHMSSDFGLDFVYWAYAFGGNTHLSSGGTFDNWSPGARTVAFYLTGEPGGVSNVPEPTTISLLGASLLGLIWTRRKRS